MFCATPCESKPVVKRLIQFTLPENDNELVADVGKRLPRKCRRLSSWENKLDGNSKRSENAAPWLPPQEGTKAWDNRFGECQAAESAALFKAQCLCMNLPLS